MIYLDMHGRLGNQLFQYAFARWLQLKTGQEIEIGFQAVEAMGRQEDGWENALGYFRVTPFLVDAQEGSILKRKTTLLQKMVGGIYFASFLPFRNNQRMDQRRKIQIIWQPLLNRLGMYWIVQGYSEPIVANRKNYILNGQFEDSRYFNEIRDILLEEFVPVEPELEVNAELYKIIRERNSVCISVRRGDYESDEAIKKVFSVCDKSYFEKAIAYMEKHVENPVFILFSDDVEWARENITSQYPVYAESGKDPIWEKLRLMYNCKHFIISNSTFSWWAQYLGRSEEKIVVSPSVWFQTSQYADLIEKDFVKV